jgi:hypothetical protein
VPTIPWITVSPPVPDREYLALISYLPLCHFHAIPKFFRFTLQIRRQLRNARGLIGYSLEAKPFARKFWTLSVWESQQTMNEFVGQIPHSAVMLALAPHMGKSQFVQWKVKHSDLPLNWQNARVRLDRT